MGNRCTCWYYGTGGVIQSVGQRGFVSWGSRGPWHNPVLKWEQRCWFKWGAEDYQGEDEGRVVEQVGAHDSCWTKSHTLN